MPIRICVGKRRVVSSLGGKLNRRLVNLDVREKIDVFVSEFADEVQASLWIA